jgi:hypothetical protein
VVLREIIIKTDNEISSSNLMIKLLVLQTIWWILCFECKKSLEIILNFLETIWLWYAINEIIIDWELNIIKYIKVLWKKIF